MGQRQSGAPQSASQYKPALSPAPAGLRRAGLPGPYGVQVLRVVDGDTFEGRIRIWFGQEITTLIRLRNIDTPELRARCDFEARLAREAQITLAGVLASGQVVISDLSPDKYSGRILADVGVLPGNAHDLDDVAAVMQAGGYARPYGGGRRQGWCS